MTAYIDVKPNVHVQIYFDGNMDVKDRDIENETGPWRQPSILRDQPDESGDNEVHPHRSAGRLRRHLLRAKRRRLPARQS